MSLINLGANYGMNVKNNYPTTLASGGLIAAKLGENGQSNIDDFRKAGEKCLDGYYNYTNKLREFFNLPKLSKEEYKEMMDIKINGIFAEKYNPKQKVVSFTDGNQDVKIYPNEDGTYKVSSAVNNGNLGAKMTVMTKEEILEKYGDVI